MKLLQNILILQVLLLFCYSCGIKYETSVPPSLSSNTILSSKCNIAIYSSNKSGIFKPYLVRFDSLSNIKDISTIEEVSSSTFISDISHDCNLVALVSDNNKLGFYDIIIYNIKNKKLKNITNTKYIDDGSPKFSPKEPLLAYLSFNKLKIINLSTSKNIPTKEMETGFSSICWSPNGNFIYLEDFDYSIIKYDIKNSTYEKVWEAHSPSFSRKEISAYKNNILFISDHDSEVSQAYALNIDTRKLTKIFPSEYDQYSPEQIGENQYVIRTNIQGNVILLKIKDGRGEYQFPKNGVIYNYTKMNDKTLIMFANDENYKSIYILENKPKDTLINVLKGQVFEGQPVATKIANKYGMTNLVYIPKKLSRGWVLWLHGGPHEQALQRYNPYIYSITKIGIGVIVLNYPGSTGIGNSYELRYTNPNDIVSSQIKSIEEDISHLKAKYSIEKLSIIGVSYGSVLAHKYMLNHPTEINQIIDISGIVDIDDMPEINTIKQSLPPMLSIVGDLDTNRKNRLRDKYLIEYKSKGNLTEKIIKGEGHIIKGRESEIQSIESIIKFLTQN